MPTKHNKKRYQREEKRRPIIVCTGNAWLEYEHEEELSAPAKGDFKLHASVEALHTFRQGDYGSTGYAGYFRVDIFDGYAWKPVLLTDLFPDRRHYFRKTECPIDTFTLCREQLRHLAGRRFVRTYREHYEMEITLSS